MRISNELMEETRMFKVSNHAFNEQDKNILREGILLLSKMDSEMVVARFWMNLTIEEIALEHSISWSEADKALSEALAKLKRHCLSNHKFSLMNIFPNEMESNMKVA